MTLRGFRGRHVYILLEDGLPIYIGSTRRLFARLGRHADTLRFDTVRVVGYKYGLEGALIRKLRPALNIRGLRDHLGYQGTTLAERQKALAHQRPRRKAAA